MKVKIVLFNIILVMVVIMIAIAPSLTTNVMAFCLFNCAAEDLKNRLQANVDCFERQIMMGVPGRTAYGTEDLSSDGKEIRIGTQWYTEEELRNDWKENPERHSSNCYFIADVTPQEVERVYQESLK
jgi:hypothetical protein